MSTLPSWGAVPTDRGTRFRLWAPGVASLQVRVAGTDHAMQAEGESWFSATLDAPAGTEYLFVLPDGTAVPDPASRRQAGDVHGASVVAEAEHRFRHPHPERPWHEAVIYEMHVGTFTPEGTFRAAVAKLDHLVDLGVTAIDILPVAQFGGRHGWGYDGVLLYCPHEAYGTPQDLAHLVDEAHGRGLKVMMDVVYNHFGPDGNYIGAYAPGFYDEARHTPWGAAIDYTRAPVRRFAIENALYWLEHFRIDGLRMDAIDHVVDPSDPDVLTEMAREIRQRVPDAWLMTEDNRNVTYLHERGEDGATPLMDGEWNDDWHNAAHVVATDETEGYYGDFADDPVGHLARAVAEGFAYQGETGPGGEARGKPSGHLPPEAFVNFLQNHDQVGNRAIGERLTKLAPAARLDALQALLLLSPGIPLLFMGEEWGATEPFLFFADFEGDLARAVTEGRRREFASFVGFEGAVPDPIERSSFEASKLNWARAEQGDHQDALARTRELIALRLERIAPLLPGTRPHAGRRLHTDREAIAVDWRLGGGLLQVRANFAHHPVAMPPVSGETIHLTGPTMGAPNSTLFAVDA
ncbi:malto-oligosyltrehalose trehalohydrolase [Jannaschia sp. W003]|uniref:malto-oligosyltrehalose trehalohydrolase n=1 Tax=Jannaschia sp. W003 TaxID=2867012 RepID=UPI0021A8D446|nr:malto-oligosyltrehalose trehalohydrolase [Jannaschia sp. W003]UWQ21752.1 malto-oligosyltrehalose trehalohydrolase [Jannaschia sp. W003]